MPAKRTQRRDDRPSQEKPYNNTRSRTIACEKNQCPSYPAPEVVVICFSWLHHDLAVPGGPDENLDAELQIAREFFRHHMFLEVEQFKIPDENKYRKLELTEKQDSGGKPGKPKISAMEPLEYITRALRSVFTKNKRENNVVFIILYSGHGSMVEEEFKLASG